MMIIEFIFAALWGYLIGAIPTGVCVARVMAGVDVRTTGSGHTGGTNVARVAGALGGGLTVLLDMCLGALAVGGTKLVFTHPWAGPIAGIMAVAGHDWSVFIRLAGGIGLAKLGGGLIAQAMPDRLLSASIAAFIVIALWLGMIRGLHAHRARSTILVMTLVGPLLWLLQFSLPIIAFGVVGGSIVIIKTLPDWHRVYAE